MLFAPRHTGGHPHRPHALPHGKRTMPTDLARAAGYRVMASHPQLETNTARMPLGLVSFLAMLCAPANGPAKRTNTPRGVLPRTTRGGGSLKFGGRGMEHCLVPASRRTARRVCMCVYTACARVCVCAVPQMWQHAGASKPPWRRLVHPPALRGHTGKAPPLDGRLPPKKADGGDPRGWRRRQHTRRHAPPGVGVCVRACGVGGCRHLPAGQPGHA